MAKFVGGPYDGMEIGHELINKHGTVMPIPAGGQNRLFLAMPPRAAWERLCRGEVAKEQAGGPLHPYERVFVAGEAEFHAAHEGALEDALAGKPDPAWQEAMGKVPHEEKLAYSLECALAQFLAGAGSAVVPPGTLGAGMTLNVGNMTERAYDSEREIITVTGTVTIQVFRTLSRGG